MTPEKSAETWKEICFILSTSVSLKMSEKDFESQVVRAIEVLGWKEFKKEIKRQPVIKIGHGNKLIPDLVVYGDKDKPLIAIEIKKPTEDLTKDDVSSQLQSYMRQLKSEYGLAIGKTIRFFYDGLLYPNQREPVLLDELKFNEDSEKAKDFVSNINKESLSNGDHTQYLNSLISKVKEKRNITKLERELESEETKEKVLAYLRNEFTEYGSEIVETALKSMEIQIKRAGQCPGHGSPGTPKEPKDGPKGETNIESVLNLIESNQTGITRKEICENLGLGGKQASNIIYRLMKRGQVKSLSKGIWVPTYNSPGAKSSNDAKKMVKKPGNIRDKVFKAVARYKKGATTEKIIARTGLETKQIRNALHALKKKGRIESPKQNLFKAVDGGK